MSGFPYPHRTLKEVFETEALREKKRTWPYRLSPLEILRLEELTRRERENNPPREGPA